MMNPDGSNQKLVAQQDCAMTTLKYFEDKAMITGDGKYRLAYVSGGSGQQIAIQDSTGKNIRIVVTLDGANYSVAFAPDNYRFAFVSEVDVNDEIYTSNTDGVKTRRLTFNTWEWDKHPSFDITGKRIVFWSNRTFAKQIWMMNDDGSDQHNISNNAFNDWNPMWIWP
jgi:TolB protein